MDKKERVLIRVLDGMARTCGSYMPGEKAGETPYDEKKCNFLSSYHKMDRYAAEQFGMQTGGVSMMIDFLRQETADPRCYGKPKAYMESVASRLSTLRQARNCLLFHPANWEAFHGKLKHFSACKNGQTEKGQAKIVVYGKFNYVSD